MNPADYPAKRISAYKRSLCDALVAGNRVLEGGGSSLDAAVAAVRVLEDNPLFNSGRGAVFNVAGKHELEASVAVSAAPQDTCLPDNRRGAAVTLLRHVKNPILLAKELYLDEQACPHPFVSGEDAERIASKKGLEIVDEHYFDTDARWREHRAGLGKPEAGFPPIDLEGLPQGTVGAVALDDHGVLACATSTGGKTNKNVGRIGDTPSMGSGFWASSWSQSPSLLQKLGIKSRRKRGVAISGTGNGDYFIRNAATYDVVARMRYKKQSLNRAARDCVADLNKQAEGSGGMIAIDLDGNVAMPLNCSGMFRGCIRTSEGVARVAVWRDELLEVGS